jgi:tetratricopeptide (TPR) repeat protein
LDLIDSWIGLYHLEPTAALIDEIWTLCHSRGEGSRLQIKVLQARAFLRFKQHNFRDCLGDFLKFREIVGPSAELAENTGHAYNSLGQLRNAELSFTESLQLMDAPGAPPKASSNRGGVLLGLGLVKERQGDLRGGLDFIYQALGFYRNKFAAANGQHSLIAKSLMSVGKCHEKLRELDQAETAFREAVAVFQATCGNNTPLTADSMFCLAKVLYAQRTFPKYQEARTYLFTSLDNYTSFDSLHIYMNIIIEITMCAVKWGTTPAPPGHCIIIVHDLIIFYFD